MIGILQKKAVKLVNYNEVLGLNYIKLCLSNLLYVYMSALLSLVQHALLMNQMAHHGFLLYSF